MSTKKTYALLSAVLICVSFTSTTEAAKHRSDGLFESASGLRNSKLPVKALRGKSRAVRANRRMLRNNRIRLNLGVGPDLEVTRERLAEHPRGKKAWIGRVIGDPKSEVILASSGDAVAGTIRHKGRLYKLEPAANGTNIIAEVGPKDPLPEMDPIPVADVVGSGSAGDIVPTAQGDGSTVVDVMVVFTPETKARYGGVSGVEAMITLAVAETNQAYQNSQIDAQLRLVHTAEVAYTESGSMNTDLENLTGKTDGVMDEVHALRDEHGADLVNLLVESTDYCGLAWQMASEHPAYEAYAFSVVYSQCATGYYSFGHELGHNMGSAHDHANGSSSIYDYSFGYQEPDSAFRTVMAYNCPGGCARVQHFSNPYVNYAGVPTGVADWADNALSLSTAAPMVATWRSSVAVALPASPANLTAAADSHEEIGIAWTDNATDESGIRIERSLDGANFAEVASLAEDTTSYVDSGLIPETTYYYRVSAFNGAGSSDYSNDAWAITSAAPVQPPAAPSDLAAETGSHTEISLDWADNADNETGFELERSQDGGANWALLANLGAGSTGYVDQSLNAETTYSYRVCATGEAGPSGHSNVATATTDAEPVYPPAAPSDVTATAESESEIALSWQDNASNETGFEIDRSQDGGLNWKSIASPGPNQSSHLDQGLDAETYYLYRVRAIGEGGPSGYGNQAGATTESAPAAAATCSVSGASTMKLYSRSAKWLLTNTGGTTVTIDRVEISWPSGQGSFKKMRLDYDEFWRGKLSGSSAVVDSGWNASTSRRQISAGDSRNLRVYFSSRYTSDKQSDYTINVHFAEGCNVQF